VFCCFLKRHHFGVLQLAAQRLDFFALSGMPSVW
jgi:hypothetical protein